MISVDFDIIKSIAKKEKIDAEKLHKYVKDNRAIILGIPISEKIAIGQGLQTKVNVNLGTSSEICNESFEIEKAEIAKKYGADTISDCSMQGNLDRIRQLLVSKIKVPITSIPVYQAVVETKNFDDITDEVILKVIEKQIKDNVSSIVLHSGFTVKSLEYLKANKRIMGIISKGGSLCAAISLCQSRENPFFTLYEDIIEIVKGTDIVINLGNAMRSGCVHDLKDSAQYEEILQNAKLAKIANDSGVPVIVEGLGGHVNAYHLKDWVVEHKRICKGRPLFVAGPLPTEIGVGYDHISAAIGGAMASGYGADYICAITPAEHLSLPNNEQIREGTVAAKIAAHVGDSIKYGIGSYFEGDKQLSEYRSKKDWENQLSYAIDPEKAKCIHPPSEQTCSMCGNYCAISIMKKYLFNENAKKN